MILLEFVRADERVSLQVALDGPLAARVAKSSPVGLADLLPVYPRDATDRGVPAVPSFLQPMAGTYAHAARGVVVFTPRYPFVAGTEYLVVARPDDEAASIRCPARDQEPVTVVEAILPELTEVPRNLLRFYVEFSNPMSEGAGERCVRLVDAASGTPLRYALLDMEPELWDPSRRRLTVLLDPGRIKRGLAPHLEAGYPLVEGAEIEIVVDPAFLDAAGRPLVEGARQRLRVGADLRGAVDPHLWTVIAPTAATAEPLHLDFDRPLDVALLARCISVRYADGAEVAGASSPSSDGRGWAFLPAAPWRSGLHRLRIDPILEDIAGNSVRRVFDRDLDDPGDAPVSRGPVEIDVEIA